MTQTPECVCVTVCVCVTWFYSTMECWSADQCLNRGMDGGRQRHEPREQTQRGKYSSVCCTAVLVVIVVLVVVVVVAAEAEAAFITYTPSNQKLPEGGLIL